MQEHSVQWDLFNKPLAPAFLSSTDRTRAIELLKALLTETLVCNRTKNGATEPMQEAKDDEDLG